MLLYYTVIEREEVFVAWGCTRFGVDRAARIGQHISVDDDVNSPAPSSLDADAQITSNIGDFFSETRLSIYSLISYA